MMTLTFGQTEKPADFEKFETITYPTFFFGFIIRNEYDQKKIANKTGIFTKIYFSQIWNQAGRNAFSIWNHQPSREGYPAKHLSNSTQSKFE